MIAWVIEEEFGVQYQLGHVHKFLHGLGFSVQWHRRIYATLRKSPLATLGAHLYR